MASPSGSKLPVLVRSPLMMRALKRMRDDTVSVHSDDSELSIPSLSELKEANHKLKQELDSLRNQLRQAKREKSYELKQFMDQETSKQSIALKDLRAKLNKEKTRELELQKEALFKKCEYDIGKVNKQKDLEIDRIQGDLYRCQEELTEMTKRGLSGTARATFVAERGRLAREVVELRGAKRHLEEALAVAKESDRIRRVELHRQGCRERALREELGNTKLQAEQEIDKLLDELKTKNHVIEFLEQNLGAHAGRLSPEGSTNEDNAAQVYGHNRTPPSDDEQDHRELDHEQLMSEHNDHSSRLQDQLTSLQQQLKTSHYQLAAAHEQLTASQEQLTTAQEQLTAAQEKLTASQEQCTAFQQDKKNLLSKLSEVEARQLPLQDKIKKFLEKNMELSSINRHLEERIRHLNEESYALKQEFDAFHQEKVTLNEQLTYEKLEKESINMMTNELQLLQKTVQEQDKTVNALKMACAEKDRRIELLAHRRRKQRVNKAQQKAAGIKETYYGYDETSSVDSELSSISSRQSSSRLSLDNTIEDDDVFDEFTREEFERNYQRLAKEHLELERSFAILQAQGSSHVDPHREVKDTGWLEEKDQLNKSIRGLKEMMEKLQVQLQESQEQNEEMEFRVLELEETKDKLSEEVKSLSRGSLPTLTSDGNIQSISANKTDVDGQVDTAERSALLQAQVVIDIANQELKECKAQEETLYHKIKTLKGEKTELLNQLSSSSDVLLELEKTKEQLSKSDQKVQSLEAEAVELRKAEAVHKYTEDYNQKSEQRYREEIQTLRRQLNSSVEGRDYESEVLKEKIDQLKEAEQRVSELQCQVSLHNETQALTESDKDTSTLLHSLNTKLSQYEKGELDLMEKTESLQTEVLSLRARLAEYEASEASLADRDVSQQQSLETTQQRLEYAEQELAARTEEVKLLQKQVTEQVTDKQVAQQIQELLQENGALKDSLKIREEEIVNLKDKLNSIQEDHLRLEGRVGEMREENAGLKQQMAGHSEVAILKDTVHKLKQTDDKSKEKIQNMESAIKILKDSLKTFLKKEDTLQKEVKGLKKNEVELIEEITKIKRVEVDLNEQIKALSEKEGELNAEIIVLKTKERELDDKNILLTNKEKDLHQEISILRSADDDLTAEVDLLRIREKELLEQIDDLKAEEREKEEADSQQTVVEDLEEELAQYKKKEEVLQDEITLLRSKEEELQDEVAHLRKEKSELEEEISVLKSREEELVEELEQLKRKDGKVQEDVGQLKKREGELGDEITLLQRKEVALHVQLEEYVQLDKAREDKIKELEAAFKLSEERSVQIESEKAELQTRVSELTVVETEVLELRELKEQVIELEITRKQLQEKLAQLQKLVEAETQKTADAENKVEELEEINSHLAAQIVELEDSASLLQDRLDHREGGDNEVLKQVQESEAKLKEQLIHVQEKLDEVRKNEVESKDKMALLMEEKERRIEVLEDQIEKMEESNVQLMESIQELQDVENHLRSQADNNDEEKSKIKEYQEELEKERKKLEEYQEKLEMEYSKEREQDKDKLKEYEDQLGDEKEKSEVQKEKDKDRLLEYELEIEKLNVSGSSLLSRIDELEETEKSLREKLELNLSRESAEAEAQTETDEDQVVVTPRSDLGHTPRSQDSQTSEESQNNEAHHERITELESRLEDLEEKLRDMHQREAKLMEEVYQKELENQEMNDHIEELLAEQEEYEGALSPGSRSPKSPRSPNSPISKSPKSEQEVAKSPEDILEKVDKLEKENSELKDQLLKAKLSVIGTLRDGQDTVDSASVKALNERVSELEKYETEAQEKNAVIHELEMELKKVKEMDKQFQEELEEKTVNEAKLKEKIDILEQSEDKLIEQIEAIAESDSQQQEEITRLTDEIKVLKVANGDGNATEIEEALRQRISKLEDLDQDQQNHIEDLETQIEILKDKLEEINTSENEEIHQLQEKVDILLDTEERLIDRLQDSEDVEGRLKAQLQEYEDEINQLEERLKGALDQQKEIVIDEEIHNRIVELEDCEQELQEKVAELDEEINAYKEKLVEMQQDNDMLKERLEEIQQESDDYKDKLDEKRKEEEYCRDKLIVMESKEKDFKDRINELEKSEAVLQARLEGISDTVELKDRNENELRGKVSHLEQQEAVMNNKVHEMEKTEVCLQTKVSDLETQNQELLSSLSKVQESSGQTHIHLNDSNITTEGAVADELLKTIESSIVQSAAPGGSSELPADMLLIERLTHEEMVSRIYELEAMEKFHKAKIEQLSSNLEEFRQAVEDITVNIETDTDIPITSFRPQTKDSEYEARVQELVKSEVTHKMRVMELIKSEALIKAQLAEAEAQIKHMDEEYRDEIEDLEDEIDKLRKSEARYKNEANYGAVGDGNALAKIQHLEGLVFDLEGTERKLKKRVLELESTEQNLKDKLEVVEISKPSQNLQEIHEKDKHYELLTELRLLELTDRDLKDKLNQLEKADTHTLLQRIAELQRSERALKRKVELLETTDTEAYQTLAMLDTPEAVLKQRIRELEKMDRHLKQQVIELERDREDLHEIARKDKNNIHELNVQVRELQLSETHLKEQVARYEVAESHLHLKVDDMTERLQDLEDQLKKNQVTDRHLRAKLHKYEFAESDLNLKYENTVEDFQVLENRLKKKITDLEKEKRSLIDKVDEQLDKISDLERGELSLKQKLKVYESSEFNLQGKLAETEQSETATKLRVVEMETLNESLLEKCQKLEEEKSSLVYEVSDLEMTKEESNKELERLRMSLSSLQERLADQGSSRDSLQNKMQEMINKEVDLQGRLSEHQRQENEWRDKLRQMERSEKKLHEHIQALEASLATSESRLNAVSGMENEHSFLNLQLSQYKRDLEKTEELKHKLEEKLKLYEYSTANHQMATVPKVELAELRASLATMEDMKHKLQELHRSENNLKETLNKLREGKDACGHEMEISDLKEKVNKYNTLVQAHELLKGNYEEVKNQLKDLSNKVKSGKVDLKEKVSTSSKTVQVQLQQAFTLKEITPELKNALRGLGAKYPEAYQEFVQTLQPEPTKMKLTGDQVREQAIVPQEASVQHVHQGSAVARQADPELVPPGGEIVQNNPLWSAIESRKPGDPNATVEETLWMNIERTSDDQDDMMVCMTFREEEDADVSPVRRGGRSRASSGTSDTSLPPPPLPNSLPPPSSFRRSESPSTESYYLPSSHHGDDPISADEASELEDDGMTYQRGQRARSAGSDSDYPGSYATSPKSQTKKHKLAGSLDSILDSGMGTLHQSDTEMFMEKVAHLERQLKKKDKELDLAQLNQKEMEKKAKDAEEAFTLKAKLKDRERELSVEKKTACDLESELEKTRADNAHQRQELSQLQAEIDSLNSFIKAKDANDNQTTAFDLDTEGVFLKHQLEKREKELKAKSNEVDRLSQELRQWQEDSRTASEKRHSAEQQVEELQRELDQMRNSKQQYDELHTNHSALQHEYTELSTRHAALQDADEEKSALEKIVLKLRGQLQDLERIELEREDLHNRLKALEEELKHMKKSESDLTKDNANLRHELDALKKENSSFRATEKDHQRIRSKFDEMERLKCTAETMVTPLRAKVIRLSDKCKTKDELIDKLLIGLKQHGEPSDLIAEADREQAHSASEEYNRPVTPLPTLPADIFGAGQVSEGTTSPVPHPNPVKVRGLSVSSAELEDLQAILDRDLINGFDRKARLSGGSSSGSAGRNDTRAHSADAGITIDDLVPTPPPPQLSRQPVTQLGLELTPAGRPNRKVVRSHSEHQAPPSSRMFVAIQDYNPQLFSTSGHQRLELSLKEGQFVKANGPADERGYYEAEVNGMIGLVPARYLQPTSGAATTRHAKNRPRKKHRQSWGASDTSPEQILDMHNQLQHSHLPNHHVQYNVPHNGLLRSRPASIASTSSGSTIQHPAFTRMSSLPGHPYHNLPHYNGQHTPVPPSGLAHTPPSGTFVGPIPVAGVPDPPSHFEVQRVIGKHSVLLSWITPKMDELASNNGNTIIGYKIYINNRDKQLVGSPYLNKALIEKLNLSRPQHFSIQTLAEDGQVSRMMVTNFDEVISETGVGEHGVSDRDSAGDADISSVLSSSQHEDGERRVFLAVYDYNPSEHSPNNFPDQEIRFQTGDIITTYGNLRSDGFYMAKAHGRKGLVPSSFVEEVALLRSHSKRSIVSNVSSSASQPHPPSSQGSSSASTTTPTRPPRRRKSNNNISPQDAISPGKHAN